ncbi:TetR/AcrR family transcriptional regulator [Rugosimonospora africana]|uniref:TetR family transcriptional regulator n=1 Tax=Rugosimonospora africana TaxID=556532 RepID=A0A8J3VWG9_9ACTN|nr:TetR/AcrR family transcriptional regulator [Rugosimonospora africana]GIH20758.1 TetR family transcriptional regulator [Rugosimonospora africana]
MTRGRPRDATVADRVVAVAGALLREGGYAGFTVDEVASRAGVAKTTLYRRWPTRDHLVAAAVATMLAETPLRDTGDARADLVRATLDIAAGLRAQTRALIAELVAYGARHDDLGSFLRELWTQRRQAASELIERGTARGQLRSGTDPAMLIDALVGPLYYRVLVTGDPITDDYVRAMADAALSGVAGQAEVPE